LDAQRKIVAVLEKAEQIKEKRIKSNEFSNEYLKSYFHELFGNTVTNSKKWGLEKLSALGTLERGKSKHRPRNDPILLGGKYPLIQTGDVANSAGKIKEYTQTYSEIGLKQSKLWPVGTLCITIAANIAFTGMLTFDACFPDSIVGFTPNKKCKVEYIQFWIGNLQKILAAQAPNSAQKNINLDILRNLDVPTPPIMLQEKFSKEVRRVEELKQKQQTVMVKSNLLFDSLMQKAFRGDLYA
jgi:type I restriction enzyme S subunit